MLMILDPGDLGSYLKWFLRWSDLGERLVSIDLDLKETQRAHLLGAVFSHAAASFLCRKNLIWKWDKNSHF